MNEKAARFASALFCSAFWVAAAHDAAAAERGLYVGGHFGQSSKDAPGDFYELFNADIQTFAFFEPTEQTSSFEDSDTAFGIAVGYRLTKHFAIEGGYHDFGTVSYRSRASGNFPLEAGTVNIGIDTETTGFTFAVIGALPLTRDWELFGRAGVLLADNKLKIQIDAQGQQFIPPLGNRFTAQDSGNTTETYAGVGVARRFFEIYDLRLEYQRAFDAGDESLGDKGDLDAVFLGLIVTF
ncbi:MAG TPA: outer membrane beta-barrel protein [Steroidobacteraceae bacterium]|nr:outer membrane beta-barrel protein [Steroidobacteraceae bacterium]